MSKCGLCDVDKCKAGNFCYGCEEFVCDECDVGDTWGPHIIGDHLIIFYEEDDLEYADEEE